MCGEYHNSLRKANDTYSVGKESDGLRVEMHVSWALFCTIRSGICRSMLCSSSSPDLAIRVWEDH